MLLGSPLLLFWLVSLLMDTKHTEAAGVWALRSQLKPHFSDSLSGASADSDFFLLLQALRALFNAAGFSAEFHQHGLSNAGLVGHRWLSMARYRPESGYAATPGYLGT